MKKFLFALVLGSLSTPSFALIGWLHKYSEIFARAGSVEICGDSLYDYGSAMDDKDSGILYVLQDNRVHSNCIQTSPTKTLSQRRDSKSFPIQYIACATISLRNGCGCNAGSKAPPR